MSSASAFQTELDRWGPHAPSLPRLSSAEAQSYTQRLAQSHYENFPVVTWLLPRELHQHFYNVYAFCRWADDLGDEVPDSEESLRLLAWWREELGAMYRGEPRHPVFVALQTTTRQYDIPPQPFEDLISAFEQDQRITEYESFEQLRDYCRRSADPVGRIVLRLCGAYSEPNVAWSDSICTGLQLANMWQDVARDFDIGRIYLPRADRDRFGYDGEALQRRETNAPFLALMEFEVDRAREFLTAGLPLVEQMPGRLKLDIELFARGGLAILREIERIDYRVWERRPVLTKRQFAAVGLQCLLRRAWRGLTSAVRPTRPATASHPPA